MAVKGVIVAAGYGSRFLPMTRVVPKELLPIVDRPAIDYVVREFVDAGIEDVLVITSRRKKALDDWFDRDPELEGKFAAERLGIPKIRASFVRQTEMKGTGHALLLARAFVGDDAFVVAYPDDLFADGVTDEGNCTAQLMKLHARTGCTVLACGDLAGEDVSRYGVVDTVTEGDVLRVRGMIEKPAKGTTTSTLVSWGRYLYTPEVFEALDAGFAKHEKGEFFATDAIAALAERGRVVAQIIPNARYDTGDQLGYLTTVIEFALKHPELGDDLLAWLRTRIN